MLSWSGGLPLPVIVTLGLGLGRLHWVQEHWHSLPQEACVLPASQLVRTPCCVCMQPAACTAAPRHCWRGREKGLCGFPMAAADVLGASMAQCPHSMLTAALPAACAAMPSRHRRCRALPEACCRPAQRQHGSGFIQHADHCLLTLSAACAAAPRPPRRCCALPSACGAPPQWLPRRRRLSALRHLPGAPCQA